LLIIIPVPNAAVTASAENETDTTAINITRKGFGGLEDVFV
jgi:hypothetical protein